MKNKELSIATSAVKDIIRYYTREAGVRGLDRAISKICRKVVKNILISTAAKQKQVKVTSTNLNDYLGVKPYNYGMVDKKDMVGQVYGLAWTSVGGELLRIECALMPGKGKVTQTGSLGEVMQESITAAITVVRSRAASLGIDNLFHENKDLHIHVPDGATPKDGPSAGITMALAVASSLSNTPVRSDVAMTGEITLRGEVQEIGGLKEKLLAALRGGIKEVIIPIDNVTANPLTGPVPRKNKTRDAIKVVTFASRIVPKDFEYPDSTADIGFFSLLISSLILSNIITLASTAMPMVKTIPAIPGRVNVA